jgi:hypothetical protein
MRLSHHRHELRSHSWIELEFRAVRSTHPIHRYEVRTSATPIVDQASFLKGRPAKEATTAKDGPAGLMLPIDVPAGERVRGTIGDLTASTRYYIAVRAVNRRNQAGPISVANISTTERTFATVTPCFIATAAYGTALAPEVSVLRRFRDRHLLTHPIGRALVQQYYRVSPGLARRIQQTPWLAELVRSALSPVLAAARWLASPQPRGRRRH